MYQGSTGRDHHIRGSPTARGGGTGRDEIRAPTSRLRGSRPRHVHDLHATMLHLLGINHLRLAVKFQGIDARLTNVSGEVVKAILA